MNGGVYFALVGDRLKIGRSCDVVGRMRRLASAHNCDVRLLGYIPCGAEQRDVREQAELEFFKFKLLSGSEWFHKSAIKMIGGRPGFVIKRYRHRKPDPEWGALMRHARAFSKRRVTDWTKVSVYENR